MKKLLLTVDIQNVDSHMAIMIFEIILCWHIWILFIILFSPFSYIFK